MNQTSSFKNKAISGILWSAVERFSLQAVQFTINIVMARLLLPSDYGMVGMLTIFLQISQAFIDGGFTNALIQRRNRTEVDYSTVFYFNIVTAMVFYLLLFTFAPLIAEFYHLPTLTTIIRVIGLNLIISSLSIVHKAKLTIQINFKIQSKISLSSALISGIIGLIMAYKGYGVWSLVCQSLINALLLTILFYSFLKWKPLNRFSLKSFNNLYSFGSKLFLSSLIHTVYYNLYAIVIGRKFSAVDLGYYTRAEQFACFPSSNLNAVISRVTFPMLSSIQDDDERLLIAYRRYIQLSSFIIFPLMIGLSVLAEPLIKLLLTDKWSGIIILLQILCFDWMFDHLSAINLNLLWVKGRSDLSLKLEIIKKTIATSILFISIPFGIVGMCCGRVLYSLIATYLNTYYTKSLMGLSLWIQLKDISPCFFLALLMGGIIYSINYFCFNNVWYVVIISPIPGCLIYISSAYLLKLNALHNLFSIWKNGKNI